MIIYGVNGMELSQKVSPHITHGQSVINTFLDIEAPYEYRYETK
jgi:hypothetical protein